MDLVRSLLRSGPQRKQSVMVERREKANNVGLLVTNELQIAIARCKAKLETLAQDCKRRNRRFRDIEFDIIEDRDRCLHGLSRTHTYSPADIRRITDFIDNPKFFVDGAAPGDITQGALGDCWFLSALAVISTAGLVEKICVARDEQVGIYGFIFWRDSGWVDVIIDDLLFCKVPPWEALTPDKRMLYHDKRELYDHTARKGSENLLFARSQTDNETWVPLIEKAYAKLHGDYASLYGGFTSEGVEDLTGGVANMLYLHDILDPDLFWKDELKHLGKPGTDRLFACFSPGSFLSDEYDDVIPPEASSSNGLIVNHAYSITRTAEYEGRRFLVIRNPWGIREWQGRWSDGSKEWNEPWTTELRKKLGYKFGEDGEFVQEYDDFLKSWGIIERCRLFTKDWALSSQWLRVTPGGTWGPGDVSCTKLNLSRYDLTYALPPVTIKIAKKTEAVIVLAQLDSRYFDELAGPYRWSLDFALYRQGHHEPLGYSYHTTLWDRSVKMETVLDPGEYVVQVRIDRALKNPPTSPLPSPAMRLNSEAPWDQRKLSRKRMEMALSQSIAVNFNPESATHLPIPADTFTGLSLTELSLEAHSRLVEHRHRHKQSFAHHLSPLPSGPLRSFSKLSGDKTRQSTIIPAPKPHIAKPSTSKTVEFKDLPKRSLSVDPTPPGALTNELDIQPDDVPDQPPTTPIQSTSPEPQEDIEDDIASLEDYASPVEMEAEATPTPEVQVEGRKSSSRSSSSKKSSSSSVKPASDGGVSVSENTTTPPTSAATEPTAGNGDHSKETSGTTLNDVPSDESDLKQPKDGRPKRILTSNSAHLNGPHSLSPTSSLANSISVSAPTSFISSPTSIPQVVLETSKHRLSNFECRGCKVAIAGTVFH
ncbi:hypothetical protein FRB99_000693, partial [Tulasnella sp. 403]